MTPFITTYTGKKVNPLDLHCEDICIEDIAHHLALVNRFGGASRKPISVAQHSVYVSRLLMKTGWSSEGLFHDAPEAYLGDMTKWMKQHPSMQPFRDAEDRAWLVICEALALNHEGSSDHPKVKSADSLMVRFEALRLCHKDSHLFNVPTHPRPTEEEIKWVGNWSPWTWQASERGFLDHARMLGFPV